LVFIIFLNPRILWGYAGLDGFFAIPNKQLSVGSGSWLLAVSSFRPHTSDFKLLTLHF